MKIDEISKKLFCASRIRADVLSKDQTLNFLNSDPLYTFGSEQDRLKISMCAPLRRLQQKTQVFPLDVKAASRNRLTHSLEVSEYSRLIAFAIVDAVKEVDLSPILRSMLNCLNNSSMLHDLGNPPFGHFGESLLRTWLKKTVNDQSVGAELTKAEKDDLQNFNGNAQGLRLSHTIQDLNLTLGQYASVIKVPNTINELLLGHGKGFSANGIESDYFSWSYANAGVFLSEKDLLDAIREQCHRDLRHPFATIIEYSDDLAYVLADLEDAFDRGLINPHTIISLSEQLLTYPELSLMHDVLGPERIEKLFNKGKTQALFYLRDVVSYYVIRDFAKAVASNLDYFIQTGEPDFSTEYYPGITVLKMLKSFEYQKVYNHFEVQTLDLSGSSYIKGLLKHYESLLFERHEVFEKELLAKGGDPFCMRIASRISRRHKETYLKSLELGKFSEIYLRIRLIVDYISGMTDTFAESEYKILSGIN